MGNQETSLMECKPIGPQFTKDMYSRGQNVNHKTSHLPNSVFDERDDISESMIVDAPLALRNISSVERLLIKNLRKSGRSWKDIRQEFFIANHIEQIKQEHALKVSLNVLSVKDQLPPQRHRFRYSREEDQLLLRLMNEGKRLPEMLLQIPGRSLSGISAKCHKLRSQVNYTHDVPLFPKERKPDRLPTTMMPFKKKGPPFASHFVRRYSLSASSSNPEDEYKIRVCNPFKVKHSENPTKAETSGRVRITEADKENISNFIRHKATWDVIQDIVCPGADVEELKEAYFKSF
ncbi:hypothetical protein NEOLI_003851 [Neolecta irregularis DAH-3]|uniref:Myb-like domain-containing protein n=1 Tax=Neolecta irregularis (strain DAH-3) TaxID=1198029 RepID=A0A1U7LN27_NEOID|nr:hypothetical protein NEOLI_003851 [Neolecta irregularis DAH-3]|eukprot:OLL24047.1 hypothetical protein NEOLI_003851 [Neolecta irregularis DAH-3]